MTTTSRLPMIVWKPRPPLTHGICYELADEPTYQPLEGPYRTRKLALLAAAQRIHYLYSEEGDVDYVFLYHVNPEKEVMLLEKVTFETTHHPHGKRQTWPREVASEDLTTAYG